MKNRLSNILLAALAALTLFSCQNGPRTTGGDPVDFVDPFIGTGGHGHVFVGASVPFGLVQLGPTSIPQSWDWCSGYHQSDSTVIGFSHTHLSGTGIGDLFDVTVMPVVGTELTYARGNGESPETGLWSYADRTKEICTPGYYSVPLTRYGVIAEMTATERVGFHRYTFPAAQSAALVFDLENGGCWDKATETHIEADGKRIKGWRFSKGWAEDQKIWFVAECDKPFTFEAINERYARLNFKTAKDEKVQLKVALSVTGIEGAEKNLAAELPGWDFKATCQQARDRWNSELGRIKITTADKKNRKIFYTALYHASIVPALFCDNGAEPEYTIFSLWDTYRAAMPLYTIIQPEREGDFMKSFLKIYERQGDLPVWHLHGNETDCMVGNPGVAAMADAVTKDIPGFDYEKAFEAMKASALTPDRGQDLRMKYGYIPADLYNQSLASDMEYAIADWALAQAACKLGKTEDCEYFLERSHSYRNFFDPSVGFMRGKDSRGRFVEPFNPYFSDHHNSPYTEGNAWQYTWLVPHDLKGLTECFGSKRALLKKLDSLFTVSSVIEGEDASSDISGLIGQYAHGNEPSHHILYFYTMLGKPWKTADLVRQVMAELYTDQPDGLSGNEDAGQMSSWYILSSMGFYQVEPAGGRYWFGSPLFEKAEIALPEGKAFTVKAPGVSADNKYIRRIWLNGQPYTKPFIRYQDIMAGGELVLEMGAEKTVWYCPDEPECYVDHRPAPENRLFTAPAVEAKIEEVKGLLTNPRLAWMFGNCFPNTLDTTVHFTESDENGHPDTFVYTGDIHAMWLRDSGAQVWPYLRFATEDEHVRKMLEGTIRRQFLCLTIDPYANAFNIGPTGSEWESDNTKMNPYDHERKWEIDSQCYPIRLAYEYWKRTGDGSVFDETWTTAMDNILRVLKEQQRKNGHGSYRFTRVTDRQFDTKSCDGLGNPVKPVGLIASAFRPSDDATVFEFLVPSNFFAVTSLRKAAEILEEVNRQPAKAQECRDLADEVEQALRKYAVYDHPKYGKIYAFEVDGFGNQLLGDDSNVPSLLAMPYLGDVPADDPVWKNTRRYVWSEDNPWFFKGAAGEGIGGPHIGHGYIWPMSIMMKAFTSDDDEEIRDCIISLMNTDAGTGFMHESFQRNDASHFTRSWFAWQNTLFGELILKLIDDGRLDLLNSII